MTFVVYTLSKDLYTSRLRVNRIIAKKVCSMYYWPKQSFSCVTMQSSWIGDRKLDTNRTHLCNPFLHVKMAHWQDESWMHLCAVRFAWCSFAWPSGFASGSNIFSISFGRKRVSGRTSHCGCSVMHVCCTNHRRSSNYHGCHSEKTSCGRNSMTQWRLSNLHYHRVCCCLPCCVINSCVYH